MNTTNTNNQREDKALPLYKKLNGKRTQGEIWVDDFSGFLAIKESIHEQHYELIADFDCNKADIDEREANKEYAVLAMNNFAGICEALECIKTNIEQIGINARTERDNVNLIICKEALKQIS